MGTAAVFGFRKNGVDKLTFVKSDGYPSGLGNDITKFINNSSYEKLHECFDRLVVRNGVNPGTLKYDEYVKLFESGEFDMFKQLNKLKDGDRTEFEDAEDFIQYSLNCEWGYIINLDNNVLEVYKGFQEEPQHNRYLKTESDNGYYNCKLILELPLNDLQENWYDGLD